MIRVIHDPGLFLMTSVFRTAKANEFPITCGFVILMIVTIPFFPLVIFLTKLLAVLTKGSELKKIDSLITLNEGAWESQFQLMLQLFIVFTRADRAPSAIQG